MKRVAEVDGRKLVIFDGLLTPEEVEPIHAGLLMRPYRRSEFARPETRDTLHWATEIDLQGVQKERIYLATRAALDQYEADQTWSLERAYCNVAQYGDMLYTHTDCLPTERDVTAVWYVCRSWNPEYGGETVFFDRTGDAREIVSPRAGRLVVFDGAIVHAGRPPSRICLEPRFTLAFKFSRT